MITVLRDIVNSHSAEEITWDDGSLLVDVQTALLLVQVYDKMNEDSNRQFFIKKIEESSASFNKIVQFSWSLVR